MEKFRQTSPKTVEALLKEFLQIQCNSACYFLNDGEYSSEIARNMNHMIFFLQIKQKFLALLTCKFTVAEHMHTFFAIIWPQGEGSNQGPE